MSAIPDGLLLEVIGDLAAAALLWLLGYVRIRIRGMLDRRDPRLRPLTLLLLVAIWIGANTSALVLLEQTSWIFFALTSFVMVWILAKEFGPLWKVGIHGADESVATGLNYQAALRLCKNQLEFLGTGAWKLTTTGAVFADALRRCHRDDRPTKFLLLDPAEGAKGLASAALRAGVDRDEYSRRVKQSLAVIADCKVRRSLNVEVRFYSRPDEFRLMFIDDSLCLASYNYYGEGDGSQLPQLHIVRRPGIRDVNSFFFPLKQYFTSLWDQAVPWTPEEWL